MTLKLYHYLHCPYCIRVRLALGYLGLIWESHVLAYDDEKTPIKLTGTKMLPIMDIDGTAMNESLDIIRALDSGNKLANEDYGDFDLVLDKLAPDIYNLAMPFWIWSPEFTPSAQRYFLKKKEIKRGPFSELIKRRNHFEANLTRTLQELEVHLNPFFNSSRLTVKDIALAAQVWGLFSVPEFRFSQKWHDYLMEVKGQCRFNYTEFHWRNP